jgi:hypothetical protein
MTMRAPGRAWRNALTTSKPRPSPSRISTTAKAGGRSVAGLRAGLAQRADDFEAAPVAEPHIDDGEGRRPLGRRRHPARHAVGGGNDEAATFHGARQPLAQRRIVVNDQQRPVGLGQPDQRGRNPVDGGAGGSVDRIHRKILRRRAPAGAPLAPIEHCRGG